MSEINTVDLEYMLLALAAAQAAETQGEVPVGAVVIIDNDVVASGFNRTIIDCDPTAHAEIVAIRKAAKIINNHRLIGICELIGLLIRIHGLFHLYNLF